MKGIFKKSIAIVMCAIMLLSAVPLTAFAQTDDVQTDIENDISMESTSAFGEMLTDTIDTQELDADSPYFISDLIFDGNNATASYYNELACTLVVAVYDEETNQMLSSAVIAVEAESLEATVSFSSLPDNFIAKAFLLDENNSSLCKPYTCNENTTVYEEFMSKTTEDFDEDRVINLDDSLTNNFVVLSDETVIVSGSDEINVLESADTENGEYIFTNINEQIKNLSVGDTFYLDNGDLENITVIKITSISIEGDKAVIVADDTTLAEAFEYVKINTEADTEDMVYDGSEADECVTYLGDVDYETGEAVAPANSGIMTMAVGVDGEDSVSKKFKIYEEGNIKADLNVKVEVKTKVYIGKEYGEVSLTVDPAINVTVEVEDKIPLKEISLGKLKTISPIPGVFINIKPAFVVEFSGKLTVSGDLTFTLGVGWNSNSGFVNKCQKPKFKPEVKVEVTFFVGFDLKPELTVLSDHVASASMSGVIGAEVEAIRTTDKEENHSCTVCTDGNIQGKLEIKVELTVAKTTPIGGEWEATLIKLTIKIADFYYSETNDKFGWGECPYKFEGSNNSSGIKANGSCGDYLIWILYNDGELVISGVGAMNVNPWNEFKQEIKSVVICNGVTSISDFAFSMCESIESVSLPNTVIDIGNTAFAACTSLKEIIIPEGVRSLGHDVFYLCSGLEIVELPESLTSINTSVFSNCTSLKNIVIPNGITQIPDYTFRECKNLEKIIMHNDITYIGDSAFAYCTKLENVDIPSGVTYIGSLAFLKCNNLREVQLPDMIRSIEENTFGECTNLTSIVIPENVTTIKSSAFEGCTKLKNITIHDDVSYIGYKAFTNTAYYNDSSNWESGGLYIGNHFITNSSNVSGFYEIKEGTKCIAGYASVGCSDLKGIIIPSSVVSVGEHAFKESGLKTITIPDSVLFIGDYAFSNCNNLTSVIIGDCVETIGSYAFEYCESLTSLYLGENLKGIGGWSFYGCDSLCSVSFPKGMKTISGSSFSSCDSLETIYLPSTIEAIYGFRSCTKLKTIYYEGSQEQWAQIDILEDNNYRITNATKHYNYIYPNSIENYQYATCSVGYSFDSQISIQRFWVDNDNVVIGNEYLLLALRQTEGEINLTSENLLYIDLKIANSSDISFDFIPKSEDIGMVAIIGDFGSGTETVVVDEWYNEYTVTWNTDGETVTQTVIEGAEITAPENPTKIGYTFAGWSPSIPDAMPDYDLTFTATWTANSYNAVFDANGGAWADGATEMTVPTDYDAEIIAPENPVKQGYIFSCWSPEIGIMDSIDGKTFNAEWIAAADTRYTVETYTMNTAGEYELSSQVLSGTTGETAEVTPEIKTGFSLNTEKSVLSGEIAADNSLVLKVYIDRNIYTLTTVADGVSSETKYYYGSIVAEPVAPVKSGYKFIEWNNEIPSTMPAENVTITAVFEKSYICPDCGNEILGEGAINEHIASEARMKATVKIKNNSGSKTINYGETLRLTAVTANMPADAKIYWYVDGVKKGEGETFEISPSSGSVEVTVKLVDANENVLKDASNNEISDSQKVSVNSSFWQKIISFFKNLFGMNRTVVQTVFKGIIR